MELEDVGKENVLQVIRELQKRDDVIYAGPDYVMQLYSTTPNDTSYYKQWAAEKIQLPQVWDSTTGSSLVTVGVIDFGIQGTHVAGIIGARGNNEDTALSYLQHELSVIPPDHEAA